jgi:EAL domain-containing protein (putative c-di-GMP-specific phosphodiesterase class I)
MKYADLAMRELRSYGCRIAIDDFGTGYASYGRLKAIQADILKIDGSFVRNMLTDSLDAYIVQSICQVARMKHLSIVAEYVETEEQKIALHELGVDYMQGYLVGKPQPLNKLLEFPNV